MPLSCKYPMYAMRVVDFLALERMLPHQELQASGLVVPLDMDAEHEPARVHFWWEPSLYSRASSSLPLKVEPPSRRRPKLAARRSAVLRAPRRLPGAMPSGQSPPESRPRPRGRAPGSPPQQQDRLRLALAAPPKAASKVPPLETDLDYYSPSPRGNRRMTVGPCWARVRGPTRRPRPRRRADVGRDCSEPKLATRTSTESSHLQ